MKDKVTPAHVQTVTCHYQIRYPDHSPRQGDIHYAAFNAYHLAHAKTAVCYVGQRVGFDQCSDATGKPMLTQPGDHLGLELHHHYLEFAVINSVDLHAIEVDYPNLTSLELVAAWAESDPNFLWLCTYHHRSSVGVHHAAAADFEASMYVRDLLSKVPKANPGSPLQQTDPGDDSASVPR